MRKRLIGAPLKPGPGIELSRDFSKLIGAGFSCRDEKDVYYGDFIVVDYGPIKGDLAQLTINLLSH